MVKDLLPCINQLVGCRYKKDKYNIEHSKCEISKRDRETHSRIKRKWYIKLSLY